MFLKLTDNQTGMDVYLNPGHIIRFIPNPEDEGTLIFMCEGAGIAPAGEAQLMEVHENSEEVFRMISRHEKPAKSATGRGLI